jgi:hypothetical protein
VTLPSDCCTTSPTISSVSASIEAPDSEPSSAARSTVLALPSGWRTSSPTIGPGVSVTSAQGIETCTAAWWTIRPTRPSGQLSTLVRC